MNTLNELKIRDFVLIWPSIFHPGLGRLKQCATDFAAANPAPALGAPAKRCAEYVFSSIGAQPHKLAEEFDEATGAEVKLVWPSELQMCGNFDIIFDHLSRVLQLHTPPAHAAPHPQTPCGALGLVTDPGADW